MPLIHGLRSTTIWKAFFLNSLASTIIIVLAIYIKGALDKYTLGDVTEDTTHAGKDKGKVVRTSPWYSVLITAVVTFIVTYASYALLYWIFGYGGGQLVNSA